MDDKVGSSGREPIFSWRTLQRRLVCHASRNQQVHSSSRNIEGNPRSCNHHHSKQGDQKSEEVLLKPVGMTHFFFEKYRQRENDKAHSTPMDDSSGSHLCRTAPYASWTLVSPHQRTVFQVLRSSQEDGAGEPRLRSDTLRKSFAKMNLEIKRSGQSWKYAAHTRSYSM